LFQARLHVMPFCYRPIARAFMLITYHFSQT